MIIGALPGGLSESVAGRMVAAMGEVIWGRFRRAPQTIVEAMRDHPRWTGFLFCLAIGLTRVARTAMETH